MPDRRFEPSIDLSQAWDDHAAEWVRWARSPGHDSYWQFHRDAFLPLIPTPSRLTLDVGCGEGRLTADLAARGHRVVGVDVSPTMVAAAREAHPGLEFRQADAVALPFADGAADLVVAFMSLMDMNDADAAILEMARVLEPGGRLAMAIVHPLNSAGMFESDEPDSPFTIAGSYLAPRAYQDVIERDGFTMTFSSLHRPLATYVDGLSAAGFLIERIREPEVPDAAIGRASAPRWQRIPLFLHLVAVRP